MGKVTNLARMTVSSAPGTGTTIALGSAVAGHLNFAASGITDGDVVTYAIADGLNREIGTATYSATGPTLTGRTVLNSTNSNAAINASATAEVFITMAASDFNLKASLSGATFTGSIIVPYLTVQAQGGTEGGEIRLAKPPTTTLAADVIVDIKDQSFRIYENGGSFRGVTLDLTGVGTASALWHANNFNPSTKLNLAGGTLTGKLVTVAPTGSAAGFNLPAGVAPTSPVDGDFWLASSGGQLTVRIGGANQNIWTSNNLQLINQAESEAGTSTTGRIISALRVRQNVAAYAAPIVHTHAISDVTNLQATLDLKLPKTSPVISGVTRIEHDTLALELYETDGPVDHRTWRIGSELGQLYMAAYNDAGVYQGAFFHVDHTTYVAEFEKRPKFAGETPWDTGNLDMTQYADLGSPNFVGNPTAPTPGPNDNSNKLSTTAYVDAAVAAVGGGGGGSGSATTTSFSPAGNIAATNVQAALTELDSEKAALAHTHVVADITDLPTALSAKLNTTGGNMSGKLVLPASTTSAAPVNAPHGTGPSAPVNGDVWTTTAGIYVRINNATIGPLVSTATIPAATTSASGLMVAADKTKLNAVGTMANRAVTISTSLPSGGADGDVWFKV